jgi:hypothetical protein
VHFDFSVPEDELAKQARIKAEKDRLRRASSGGTLR